MIAQRRLLIHFTLPALFVAFAGCDDEPLSFESEERELTPFLAQFSSEELYRRPAPACGYPPRYLTFHSGEGLAEPGGSFTIEFSYCLDLTDVVDDGKLTEGEWLPFDNVQAKLVLANGDELYIGGSGTIVPSADPDFDLECHDYLSLTGGTGQFASARGVLRIDDYMNEVANEALHEWRGTLIQPK